MNNLKFIQRVLGGQHGVLPIKPTTSFDSKAAVDHSLVVPIVEINLDVPFKNMEMGTDLPIQADVEKVGCKPDAYSTSQRVIGVMRDLKSCDAPGYGPRSLMIVESLLYSILARKNRVFEKREYYRMLRSLRNMASSLSELEDERNSETDFVKYHLAITMAKAAADKQVPPKPVFVTKPLFSGWLRNCVNRAIAQKDLSFIYSLSQSKRGWPELGKVRELEAIADHKKFITGEKRGRVPLDLLEMIERTSLNIFGPKGEEFERVPEPTKLMPSGSACLQASRGKGGSASLFKQLKLPVTGSKLGRMRDLVNVTDAWRQDVYKTATESVRQRQYDRESGILDVEVQILPEPAKFRIITKGDGFLYTALQPVQGQMLSAWKKHPASTMTVNVESEVNRIYRNTPREWKWMSVDYKSATDLLLKESSNAVLMPLVHLPDQDIIWLSQQNARVHYPDGTVLDQTEGQLMGHPLSFTALCTINLSCFFCAVDRWLANGYGSEKDGQVLRKNVLCNGDDMLFRAPPSFVRIFYETTEAAGLVISVGKNYFSSEMALINSELYQLKGDLMVRKGYLNLKLVKGSSLKDGNSSATPEQIGSDVSRMVDLCPWAKGCIPEAFQRWSDNWKGWFRPNWYLPVHLGGYGVSPAHAPKDYKITKQQRLMAAKFVHDPRLALYRTEGFDIKAANYAGMVASFKLQKIEYLDDILTPAQQLTNDWLARIAYVARASSLSVVKTSDAVANARLLSKSSRLKPMSIKTLDEWRNAQMIASGVPACPPLGIVRVTRENRQERLTGFGQPRTRRPKAPPAEFLRRFEYSEEQLWE